MCSGKGIVGNFSSFMFFHHFQSLVNKHVLFSQWKKIRCFKEDELYSILLESSSETLDLSAKPRASSYKNPHPHADP